MPEAVVMFRAVLSDRANVPSFATKRTQRLRFECVSLTIVGKVLLQLEPEVGAVSP